MNDLKNAWALVTGASSGIGRVYARELANIGMNLIVVARRAEKLEDLKKEIESEFQKEVVIIQSDLSLREEPKKVFETAIAGREVQVLINNAGSRHLYKENFEKAYKVMDSKEIGKSYETIRPERFTSFEDLKNELNIYKDNPNEFFSA